MKAEALKERLWPLPSFRLQTGGSGSQHFVSNIFASSSRMLRCVHKHWMSCLGGHGMGTSLALHLHSGYGLLPQAWLPVLRSLCEHTNVLEAVDWLLCKATLDACGGVPRSPVQ